MSDATPDPSPDAEIVTVHAAEVWISNILRVGVWLSLALVLIGMTVTFARHPDYRHAGEELTRLTNPGDAVPHTIGEVIDGLRNFRGRAIIELGLLTLIATPVIRVAASVVVFVSLRDRRFVLITLVVLALLLLSFWIGGAEG